MDIFKKVGESVKKAGKTISDDMKAEQEASRNKRQILDGFEMKDLKGICKDYGIGEPSPYEEDFFGEKTKRKITREHYIDWIMERLNLEQIKNYAQKKRVLMPETFKEQPQPLIIQPKTELEQPKAVSESTTPVSPSVPAENPDEEKLKRRLAIIKEFSPKTQFKKEAEINRLLGQLISYRRFFKHIIIVIFNPRDVRAITYLKNQIKELGLAASVISK